jgi:hypothetical protein
MAYKMPHTIFSALKSRTVEMFVAALPHPEVFVVGDMTLRLQIIYI